MFGFSDSKLARIAHRSEQDSDDDSCEAQVLDLLQAAKMKLTFYVRQEIGKAAASDHTVWYGIGRSHEEAASYRGLLLFWLRSVASHSRSNNQQNAAYDNLLRIAETKFIEEARLNCSPSTIKINSIQLHSLLPRLSSDAYSFAQKLQPSQLREMMVDYLLMKFWEIPSIRHATSQIWPLYSWDWSNQDSKLVPRRIPHRVLGFIRDKLFRMGRYLETHHDDFQGLLEIQLLLTAVDLDTNSG